MIELIGIDALNDEETVVVDVRQPEELRDDPIADHPHIKTPPLHIPLPEFVARLGELPTNKRLAFICAGNIRSRQAADYCAARGYDKVCVLDKFTL